jgi:DNA-binding IclR family transcriptional regulator
MRKASEKLKLNVGLAVADRLEMVYLESVRYNRNIALRVVAAGQRVPIERTSLGMAWIAKLSPVSQEKFLSELKAQKMKNWDAIEQEILSAIQSMNRSGYCQASWLPEISAISSSVQLLHGRYASLNFSSPAQSNLNTVLASYSPQLIELRDKIESAIKDIS